MSKIIHIVPEDRIGGVEVAAKTCAQFKDHYFQFKVVYISPGGLSVKFLGDLRNIVRTVWRLRSEECDVFVLSLWKSALVGVLLKLFRPKARLVTMLHSPVRAHLLDTLFTWLAIQLSSEVWGDSQASLTAVSSRYAGKTREISFITHKLVAPIKFDLHPRFIFWGRLAAEKNLSRAIMIFSRIHQSLPVAKFDIFGPDGGERDKLESLCSELNLGDSVRFRGEISNSEIAQHTLQSFFYLQTSVFEGMAMSVVEAMQLGLVPIVTPVGGIATYCEDGVNSLLIRDDIVIVEKVLSLVADADYYSRMRNACISVFSGSQTYQESIIDACKQFLLAERQNQES